ncbi:tRNA (cytosine(32)/uridine(32)-2'-O)-methyltransferase TrmJ ['Osedax' symbiont bacterium Rs2_46_30_T18]|nr:tRNA (cytosine(32)/uridine(32)-2'-O)-methyltransferase TrmJ ['Osedax' symbiont bacterium Rs2_46_30_T18]
MNFMQLNNIRIVLINTFHPGNIGAAARALKNMGLSNLYLVDPVDFPHDEAVSRAAGAQDVLENAVVVSSLQEAISDCQLVIGTSARNRTFDLPLLDVKDCANKILGESTQGNVAILFGRESKGLLNEELSLCNFHLFIPTNPEYPVLNISQAIQLVSYEIWLASQEQTTIASSEYPLHKEMAMFYQHLEQVLRKAHFLIPQHEGRAMQKLQRFFNRSRPEKQELGMLRGVLSSIEKRIDDLQK